MEDFVFDLYLKDPELVGGIGNVLNAISPYAEAVGVGVDFALNVIGRDYLGFFIDYSRPIADFISGQENYLENNFGLDEDFYKGLNTIKLTFDTKDFIYDLKNNRNINNDKKNKVNKQ